jgi:hypothetical protein
MFMAPKTVTSFSKHLLITLITLHMPVWCKEHESKC